jgi:hypothetical protein
MNMAVGALIAALGSLVFAFDDNPPGSAEHIWPGYVVVAALAVVVSLGAGIFKRWSDRESEKSDRVTVTVQRGGQRIEKEGIMRPDEASRMLEMVEDVRPQARPEVSTK